MNDHFLGYIDLMKTKRFPTYFISHGGGPWPWLKKEMPFYDKLEASLKDIPQQLPEKPKALLVISGHWEDLNFLVMSSPKPEMVYDYHGFPKHTYSIQWPAPGAPELAEKVMHLIQQAGLPTGLDSNRGFDHGTFSPLAVMYPNAEIPTFQVAIRSDYDPKTHLQLGRALASLRDEGVLIIASGLSYHNLRAFGPAAQKPSRDFDLWLRDSMQLPPPLRRERLLDWRSAPAARIAHPQEDHLIPLMVAVGAAENEEAKLIYHEDDFMGGISVSSYRFG